jgi:hypothetical protein
MFLVPPSWKLAEHDLIDGVLCPSAFTYPLQKPFGVHANDGEAGARWFSMTFIKTEHCYVFMYVTNVDDPFSLYCYSCLLAIPLS